MTTPNDLRDGDFITWDGISGLVIGDPDPDTDGFVWVKIDQRNEIGGSLRRFLRIGEHETVRRH